MQTKLTLRMDDALVRKAKAHAKRTGRSLSQMVADFFALLDSPRTQPERDLSPAVRALKGALRGSKVTKEDYYRYLEEKYK